MHAIWQNVLFLTLSEIMTIFILTYEVIFEFFLGYLFNSMINNSSDHSYMYVLLTIILPACLSAEY